MLKKILKFKLRFFALLIVFIAVVQLATSFIFGFKTKSELDKQFTQMTNSPFIQVVSYVYNKGLFSSNVTAEIKINSKLLANVIKIMPNIEESSLLQPSYSIKYNTRIEHGIFSGILDGYFVPTIAVARTTIEYPDTVKKILDKFFIKNEPLTIDNVLYLNNSGEFYVSSPLFNYEEALSGVKVNWGGAKINIKYNKMFNQFNNTFSIPEFSLLAPTKGIIKLNDMSYNSDSIYSKNKIKVGKTNLHVNQLKVNLSNAIKGANMGFKLGDMLSSLTGISASELLNEIDVVNASDFTLNKLAYTSVSSDSSGYFNAGAKVNFESLETESNIYGPLSLDVSIEHVASVQFSELMDNVSKLSTESNITSDTGQKILVNTLKKYFGPILVDTPMIKINKFCLNTPSGLINLSGVFTTDNFILSDMNNQSDFLKKLKIEMSLSIPRSILSYLMMVQMRYYLSAGNAEMDKQSSDALKKVVNILLESQLATWKKKGYLEEKNGIISSKMHYSGGKVLFK